MFLMGKMNFDIYLDIVSKLKMKKRAFKHYFDTNLDIVSKFMDILMVMLSMKKVKVVHIGALIVINMVVVSMCNKIIQQLKDMIKDIVSLEKNMLVLILQYEMIRIINRMVRVSMHKSKNRDIMANFDKNFDKVSKLITIILDVMFLNKIIKEFKIQLITSNQ